MSLDFIVSLPGTSTREDYHASSWWILKKGLFRCLPYYYEFMMHLILPTFTSKKLVRLHGVPHSTGSDKVLSPLWITMWRTLITNLKCTSHYSILRQSQTKVTKHNLELFWKLWQKHPLQNRKRTSHMPSLFSLVHLVKLRVGTHFTLAMTIMTWNKFIRSCIIKLLRPMSKWKQGWMSTKRK